MRKLMLYFLGTFLLIFGIIGALTPLTPWTMPVLIGSAWCFGVDKHLPEKWQKKSEQLKRYLKKKAKK